MKRFLSIFYPVRINTNGPPGDNFRRQQLIENNLDEERKTSRTRTLQTGNGDPGKVLAGHRMNTMSQMSVRTIVKHATPLSRKSSIKVTEY